MSELPDFELHKPDPDAEPEPGLARPPSGDAPWWIAGIVVALIAAGGGAYFFLRRAPIPPARPAPPSETLAAEPSPSPLDVGPLDASDPLVAELARALSSDPRWLEWFRAKDLVRRFVAAVAQVAAGESPRKPLEFLTPKGAFGVVEARGRTVIDPRSYARYDAFVAVVSQLDVAACARAMKQIQPLLDTAYAEAGQPDGSFRAALQKALRTLLDTPLPAGDVVVRRAAKPIVYEYVDPKLEALQPAQKHLLRMGPANAKKLLGKLRELGEALELHLQ